MVGAIKILSSKLRKALAQLPYLPRALKLVWDVARPWTVTWIVLLIVQGLLPAATVYLTKLIVDGVVARAALRPGLGRAAAAAASVGVSTAAAARRSS